MCARNPDYEPEIYMVSLTGKRDPYEIIDFCVDTVYEKGVSIVPLKNVA